MGKKRQVDFQHVNQNPHEIDLHKALVPRPGTATSTVNMAVSPLPSRLLVRHKRQQTASVHKNSPSRLLSSPHRAVSLFTALKGTFRLVSPSLLHSTYCPASTIPTAILLASSHTHRLISLLLLPANTGSIPSFLPARCWARFSP